MGVFIRGMEMPKDCLQCYCSDTEYGECVLDPEKRCPDDYKKRADWCPLVPVPPHGDLIDRDALIKDGWLNLHKEVIRMGGYAIHELPLKNPSIPVIIPAEESET